MNGNKGNGKGRAVKRRGVEKMKEYRKERKGGNKGE